VNKTERPKFVSMKKKARV